MSCSAPGTYKAPRLGSQKSTCGSITNSSILLLIFNLLKLLSVIFTLTVPDKKISQLEIQSALNQLPVLAFVKLVESRRTVRHAFLHLAQFTQHIHRKDLFSEVAIVQLAAEDDLVKLLQ